MKSFFSIFERSAKELSSVRCICVTGMLMALSIVLRSMLYIPINEDLRVSFAFIGSMIIATLFGPCVGMVSAAGIDVIGYILDGAKMREYNIWLLLIKLVMAAAVGLIMYREKYGSVKLPKSLSEKLNPTIVEYGELAVRSVIARAVVVFIGNIVLNSIVLYKSYTNPKFPFMSDSEWTAFKVWLAPRITKNLIMFPIECAICIVAIPLIYAAYLQVFRKRVKKAA